jgi:hypothetical protein
MSSPGNLSTSSSNNTKTMKVKVSFKIPSMLMNLGIAIYAAIILSNNSKNIVSTEVYGFVMTICVINFVSILTGLCCICQEKDNTASIWSFVGLGMFIWSCVILFGQNGIDYKDSNPYYMFVFVYFLLSIISLGIVLISLPFICCFMCYKLSKEEERTVSTPVPDSTPAPPSTPVSTPDSTRASTPTNDTISIIVV